MYTRIKDSSLFSRIEDTKDVVLTLMHNYAKSLSLDLTLCLNTASRHFTVNVYHLHLRDSGLLSFCGLYAVVHLRKQNPE